MNPSKKQRRGSAVVALLIVAVLILGSMVMLHTASVIDVQRMERAIEIGRENRITALRVVQAARESAQRTFGASGEKTDGMFRREFSKIISLVDDSSVVAFGAPTADLAQTSLADFPNWSGPPALLSAPSPSLLAQASPQLRFLIGNRVAESARTTLSLAFSRTATGPGKQTYDAVVAVRLVSVPLTRFSACGYDLPNEVGTRSGNTVEWPHFFPVESLAPSGLVPTRDPASVTGFAADGQRPAHFRYLAALSEQYQYVFSQAYLQRLTDFAGTTHYFKAGAGKANPGWPGAQDIPNGLKLDVGEFGPGVSASLSETKNCGVICSGVANTRIILSDDGSQNSAILLAIAGPADLTQSATRVVFTTPIRRPLVLIGYHISLEASSPISVNGALFLDRESVVADTAGPFTVGHVSYWEGGATKVSLDAFRPGTLPPEAAALAPRVVYAVASEEKF